MCCTAQVELMNGHVQSSFSSWSVMYRACTAHALLCTEHMRCPVQTGTAHEVSCMEQKQHMKCHVQSRYSMWCFMYGAGTAHAAKILIDSTDTALFRSHKTQILHLFGLLQQFNLIISDIGFEIRFYPVLTINEISCLIFLIKNTF